jgi:hypothetical protein
MTHALFRSQLLSDSQRGPWVRFRETKHSHGVDYPYGQYLRDAMRRREKVRGR